jgi:hypothetical protein
MINNRGQSQYLRIFDETSTYYRWQSYYVNQTVTWQSASWSYQPFVVNGLVAGSSGSGAGISVTIPATTLAVDVFSQALTANRLCEVRAYEFDSLLIQSMPQSSQALIASFVGEIIGIGGSFTELTIELGSSLAPVGAQAPPRNFTSILIGAPLRL